MMPKHEWPTTFKVSAGLGMVSICIAVMVKFNYLKTMPWGYTLLGLWTLVPPLWFLYEFQSEFPRDHKKPQEEVDRLKHIHDLSRNIWVAFIVVLAAIMGKSWMIFNVATHELALSPLY